MPASNELALSVALNYRDDYVPLSGFSQNVSGVVDVTGTRFASKVIEIGTTDESVAKDDLTTVGFVLIKNLDDTNFISAGDDGTNYPIKILAEEFSLFRLNGNTLHLIADTAACEVEVHMIEE